MVSLPVRADLHLTDRLIVISTGSKQHAVSDTCQ